MCKHIINVQVRDPFHEVHAFDDSQGALSQVAFRAPCCKRWFDCTECHFEMADHPIAPSPEMAFACKQCKKCFRKIMSMIDISHFSEEDEYCPHCNNHFVVKAERPTALSLA
ncbi:hypothetical protein AaE_011078 [Aphanomyces astaci]|uniref:CHY-type domain-containing protein n=1 Tax=Aphanomyces astaci TaxID=112090 RepID=A0A6A4ZLV3_APHAT|nr:hypothetical protein AaE_011078 [Aphanomyces astaci]